MRLVFGLVLVAGIGLAGFAVYTAKTYIGAYETELEKERANREKIVPTVEVYVAQRALGYGEMLVEEDVRLVRWPKDAIPEGSYTAEDKLFSDDPQMQRVVLRAIEKDEALLAVKLSKPGEDAGLTSRLERGMRAFTIKVDVTSGVSGFLRPGDRVDVYWTGRIPGKDPNLPEGEVTKLIQTGVKLIAIDQTANDSEMEATIARTVTVAVTPQQVAGLAQAQSTGKLSLSLMGTNDDTVAEAIEVDQLSLLGIKAETVSRKPVAEVCTIRTRRGADVVEIPIPCTN